MLPGCLCDARVCMHCTGVYVLHGCLCVAVVYICCNGVYLLQGCICVARVCMCCKGGYVLLSCACKVMHSTAQYAATQCNTLQHNATPCNTLQLEYRLLQKYVCERTCTCCKDVFVLQGCLYVLSNCACMAKRMHAKGCPCVERVSTC